MIEFQSADEAARSDVPLIGLSIGGCVQDIVRNIVPLSHVVVIISGSKCETVDELIDAYVRNREWKDDMVHRALVTSLWSEHKIIQPRLMDIPPPYSTIRWKGLTTQTITSWRRR